MSAFPTPDTRTKPDLKVLRTDRQAQVLHIELHTPEAGNAVTEAMLDELLMVLDDPDPTVRVIVLSGAGSDFCLGGDRTELTDYLAQDPTGGGIRTSGIKARRVCEALTSNPAVTIAKVQGKAIGAGLALVLACDLRVGAENATFRLPELALGLPTAWGGLLPRLLSEVGSSRVRELILTCRAFDAYEAVNLSVLHNVVPEDDLDQAVAAWARPILRRPPGALRVTKSLLNSYAAASRLSDTSALDSELMASVVAAEHYSRAHPQRRTGHLF
ncbi:enoyl-CoA hydratase/isomerase family protein [Streptomyces cavernae]|uniref:enoyl-CoA hydratase/isomerase family protein n=1 Tax=Streptomyces cavernae TaxID=2259034 RepID=UPI000FEBB783|nr:enoyl-CoA hydratase/isomerase family protein [Streptomyces cavernae]